MLVTQSEFTTHSYTDSNRLNGLGSPSWPVLKPELGRLLPHFTWTHSEEEQPPFCMGGHLRFQHFFSKRSFLHLAPSALQIILAGSNKVKSHGFWVCPWQSTSSNAQTGKDFSQSQSDSKVNWVLFGGFTRKIAFKMAQENIISYGINVKTDMGFYIRKQEKEWKYLPSFRMNDHKIKFCWFFKM